MFLHSWSISTLINWFQFCDAFKFFARDSLSASEDHLAGLEPMASSTGGLVRNYFICVIWHEIASKTTPEYAICVIFTTRLYYKALGLGLCDLIWQIRHNYNRPDDGYYDVTGHRKMSVMCTVGAMMTTHGNSVMMWLFNELILFFFL